MPIDVTDLVESYFYRPLIAAVLFASRFARRLQSGRLDAYMAYMIAVLAVLGVVIATS